jgi:hypothetical protein
MSAAYAYIGDWLGIQPPATDSDILRIVEGRLGTSIINRLTEVHCTDQPVAAAERTSETSSSLKLHRLLLPATGRRRPHCASSGFSVATTASILLCADSESLTRTVSPIPNGGLMLLVRISALFRRPRMKQYAEAVAHYSGSWTTIGVMSLPGRDMNIAIHAAL